MKKVMLYAAIPTLLLLTACGKDDPIEPTASTKTSHLINGSWKLTTVVSDEDGNGTYETDDFATFPPCFTDNFIVFKANLQIEINEGLTKCDPNDPQIESGTWSLANNENNLVVNADTYPLVELSNTTLKWREEGPGNTSSIVTLTKR